MKKKLLFLLTFVLLLACVFTACNHEDDLFGGMLPEDGADGPADNTQTPPPNQGEQEEGEEEEGKEEEGKEEEVKEKEKIKCAER